MAKKPGRVSKIKKATLVAGAVAAIGGAGWLGVSFGGGKPINVPTYKAIKVIDGDTFDTDVKQLIRIASVDAPELDSCGGEEAKKELERLILDKDVYLKVFYRDSTRLMAVVYTKDGLVAEKMLASGWAELHGQNGAGGQDLIAVTKKVQAEKRGVFSNKCTQTINPEKPNCKIKGNRNPDNKKKIYYFPGCNIYDTVLVQLHHGDQWFCTETEAKKAGFTKAERCPDKYQPSR